MPLHIVTDIGQLAFGKQYDANERRQRQLLTLSDFIDAVQTL